MQYHMRRRSPWHHCVWDYWKRGNPCWHIYRSGMSEYNKVWLGFNTCRSPFCRSPTEVGCLMSCLEQSMVPTPVAASPVDDRSALTALWFEHVLGYVRKIRKQKGEDKIIKYLPPGWRDLQTPSGSSWSPSPQQSKLYHLEGWGPLHRLTPPSSLIESWHQ